MPVFLDNPYNPNPISKLLVTFSLGFAVFYKVNTCFEWGIVFLLSALFYKNGLKKEALKNILFFGVLCLIVPNIDVIRNMNAILMMVFMLFAVFRMFYLPFSAGSFFVKTSDVGSLISSMDKIKLPRTVSIPIAVMFRFFPSFIEERRNIKLAMRIRGIIFKNPISYIEYVMVPLLVISSNISDDIAKAAETKCIENPIRKTRYISVKLKIVDFVYVFLMVIMIIGGIVW
ncbi:energy-coupling factor transporter transmembrane component T [Treponema pedis]|uniref:Energy-coupling factor transporter transmembrane protein EcfT n=1 Tax=Treponema pedis TaxID=409322 RepID=A0A7S7AVP2_9SPIR|nr:energy-coupling factor transporter transmembrane component T [Treponema pedis]QOW60410.1 energy-coupling factor transporter transmembrane protein EcfT [Treponema pedis]